MKEYNIALLAGDGTGKEVTDEITGSRRSCERWRRMVKSGRIKSSYGGLAYDETAN